MGLEISATYENGILKLERPLPLENGQQVRLTVHPPGGRVRRSQDLLKWTGSQEELDQLLGPDNQAWAAS